MRYSKMLLIGLGLVAVVAVAIVANAWIIKRLRWAGEVPELRERIEALESREPGEGGAETDPPIRAELTTDWVFPIAPEDYLELTSPFGYRISPILRTERYHTGVDIAAVWRAQVVAARDGVVVEHWPPPDGYYKGHPVLGGLVVIEHDNGWHSSYAHLSTSRVRTGQFVRAGTVIGRVGSTGRARGNHLHLELQDATGRPVNPLLYVQPDPGRE